MDDDDHDDDAILSFFSLPETHMHGMAVIGHRAFLFFFHFCMALCGPHNTQEALNKHGYCVLPRCSIVRTRHTIFLMLVFVFSRKPRLQQQECIYKSIEQNRLSLGFRGLSCCM